jgi:hypothetical protein
VAACVSTGDAVGAAPQAERSNPLSKIIAMIIVDNFFIFSFFLILMVCWWLNTILAYSLDLLPPGLNVDQEIKKPSL